VATRMVPVNGASPGWASVNRISNREAASHRSPSPASEHDPVLAQRRDENCRAPHSRRAQHPRSLVRIAGTAVRYRTVRFVTVR
jgi:hypothetical protein